MGVFETRGPEYGTLNTTILVMRIPKIRYPQIFGNPQKLKDFILSLELNAAWLPQGARGRPEIRPRAWVEPPRSISESHLGAIIIRTWFWAPLYSIAIG